MIDDQEAGDRRLVRLVRKVGDRAGVERARIDVHARAWLDDIGDDQADDQRERGEEQEIAECLGGDAADASPARACRRSRSPR